MSSRLQAVAQNGDDAEREDDKAGPGHGRLLLLQQKQEAIAACMHECVGFDVGGVCLRLERTLSG